MGGGGIKICPAPWAPKVAFRQVDALDGSKAPEAPPTHGAQISSLQLLHPNYGTVVKVPSICEGALVCLYSLVSMWVA